MGVETTGYSSILCVGTRRGPLATVGRDGCARGREWQQLGQQRQQGRDPQRLDSLCRMLRGHSDRSATPPVGQVVARPQDLLVPFLLIKRLPSLQSDEFLDHTKVQILHIPLWRRLHCWFCCRHSLGGQCGNHNKKLNFSTDLLEFKRPICFAFQVSIISVETICTYYKEFCV